MGQLSDEEEEDFWTKELIFCVIYKIKLIIKSIILFLSTELMNRNHLSIFQ